MNKKDQEQFLLKLGWVLRREETNGSRSMWRVTSVTIPRKVTEFASLREIDECLKRKLQSEMAVQRALQEFELVHERCSQEECEKLKRWMSTGHRDQVWHLTSNCIEMSWTIPELPRQWRSRACKVLALRLDKEYEELWKRAAEKFLGAAQY
ncbi:hypothetical protein P2C08_17035 [Xanthomonas perforans]|uniref:hypothetical protein n=1 Tax=Xanthomonas euvesicatoria TaxID=456327 RepID=UPI0030C84A7C